jgi:hypothetical protein
VGIFKLNPISITVDFPIYLSMKMKPRVVVSLDQIIFDRLGFEWYWSVKLKIRVPFEAINENPRFLQVSRK